MLPKNISQKYISLHFASIIFKLIFKMLLKRDVQAGLFFLRKVKWISDFQRHILRFGIENKPDIEKALFVLIYSSRIAKPLINHIGIRLAISMTATNIINKCETAKHLKSKCMEIQLQGKRGRGIATFPTLCSQD